ncbi:glycoside hydrolase family 17 protein [Crassisporium funariophilum]|nr:glycoside hydrolase family 17 protein [Crassisporium funariophilum]
MTDVNYQSLGMSAALEKQQQRKRRSKWIVIGSLIALIVLIAIGVTVGVVVSKNSSEKSGSGGKSSSTGGSSNGTGTGGGTTSDPNDPSVFTKDPALHKAFYGLAYTPEGSLPDYGCSNSLAGVIKDIQIISQLTKRIRLYGADCNQTALVLEAIKQTKVDVEVFVGIYVVDGDHPAYERQRDAIKAAIETYGTDHIAGVTVGNEFMLNYVTGHSSQDPNSAIGNEGAVILKADIDETRAMLAAMKLPKTILIGNSDAGSYFNTEIMKSIDYGLSNVHAWFANTTAEGAASWVTTFFDETNLKPAALLPNNPKMYIAETGWPTGTSTTLNPSPNNGAADASVPNLQTFMDTFVCQANTAGIGYFYFEFVDEEWKDTKYGGVEGHWGLFTKERVLKDIKIPTCVAP